MSCLWVFWWVKKSRPDLPTSQVRAAIFWLVHVCLHIRLLSIHGCLLPSTVRPCHSTLNHSNLSVPAKKPTSKYVQNRQPLYTSSVCPSVITLCIFEHMKYSVHKIIIKNLQKLFSISTPAVTTTQLSVCPLFVHHFFPLLFLLFNVRVWNKKHTTICSK